MIRITITLNDGTEKPFEWADYYFIEHDGSLTLETKDKSRRLTVPRGYFVWVEQETVNEKDLGSSANC